MATLYDMVSQEAQQVAREYDEVLTPSQIGNIYSGIGQIIRTRTQASMYLMSRIRADRPIKDERGKE